MAAKNQITMGDYDIQLTPDTVPEKYKEFVHFYDMEAKVYFDGFNNFDLIELLTVDKLLGNIQTSQIELMLMVKKISYHACWSGELSDNTPKEPRVYDLFRLFFGMSKTNVKNCLRVYHKFWVEYCHVSYLNFSFSQLVEMCPISKADMQCITPEWSVRMIRDYKKSLTQKLTAPKKKKEKAEDAASEYDDEDDESIEAEIPTSGISVAYITSLIEQARVQAIKDCPYGKGITPHSIYTKAITAMVEKLKFIISMDKSFIV